MASRQEPHGEHYLFTHGTDTEMNRLNHQSGVISLLRNHQSLEPTIPISSIHRVADVATGTGIWLEELSRGQLKKQDVEYVGFDISSSLFPNTCQVGMKFVEHDLHAGFSEEYLGTFDVVHVRLIIIAVQKHEFNSVINNLALLKPGGWLPWDDFSFVRGAAATYCGAIQPEGEMILEHLAKKNWSLNTTADIVTALTKYSPPISRIGIRDYYEDSYGSGDIQKQLMEWALVGGAHVFEQVLQRNGYDETAVEEKVEEFRKKVTEMGEKGQVFSMPLVSVTAQKSIRNEKL